MDRVEVMDESLQVEAVCEQAPHGEEAADDDSICRSSTRVSVRANVDAPHSARMEPSHSRTWNWTSSPAASSRARSARPTHSSQPAWMRPMCTHSCLPFGRSTSWSPSSSQHRSHATGRTTHLTLKSSVIARLRSRAEAHQRVTPIRMGRGISSPSGDWV